MRGTLSHEAATQPSVHLLSLYEVSTGIVLAQRAVQTKENEISAVPDLLLPVLIKGRIWSADAMHTQKKMCAQLTQNEGDYLLIAKDNQPTTRSDLELFFEDPEAERAGWQSSTPCEKGHGRLEKRTLTGSLDLTDYFPNQWPGIAQVFRLERSESRERAAPLVRRLWPHQPLAQEGLCKPSAATRNVATGALKTASTGGAM